MTINHIDYPLYLKIATQRDSPIFRLYLTSSILPCWYDSSCTWLDHQTFEHFICTRMCLSESRGVFLCFFLVLWPHFFSHSCATSRVNTCSKEKPDRSVHIFNFAWFCRNVTDIFFIFVAEELLNDASQSEPWLIHTWWWLRWLFIYLFVLIWLYIGMKMKNSSDKHLFS